MDRLFGNNIFSTLVRIVLGCIFVYASLDKIANTAEFAKLIYNYRLLPAGFENLLAIFLPWIELITGLFLIVGKFTKGSLIIYTTLLVVFIIALSQALIRGLDISCGCFSVKPSSTSEVWLRIIEDLVLLFLSISLYHYTKAPKTEESLIQQIN